MGGLIDDICYTMMFTQGHQALNRADWEIWKALLRNFILLVVVASPIVWFALTGFRVISIDPHLANVYGAIVVGVVYVILWPCVSFGINMCLPPAGPDWRRRLVDVRACMTQPHTTVSEVSMTPLDHLLQECEAMQ